ncbi:hypothetical protein FSOLCH5_002039 [Fusarium solani]
MAFTKTWRTEPYGFIDPKRPEISAAEKNVIITGGGTGIGKATAIAFAQAGAKSVAILGRRLDRLESGAAAIKEAGKNTAVVYKAADLTVRAEADMAIQSIVDEVGKIDVFVSNAGSLPELGEVADYDPTKLIRAFELNVLTTLNALHAFKKSASPRAVLINISTAFSHQSPVPGVPVGAYAVSKAAGLKLVDYFGSENPDIHFVHLHPGVVETELNQSPGQNEASLPAHFSVWAASPEAKFLKGKFVWVNWDAEELLARAEEIKEKDLLAWKLNGVSA